VSTHVSAPSLNRDRVIVRSVSVRTKDDTAVIQDLPDGRNQLGHGFPITPAFDALSYFTLSWKVGWHQDVSAYVHDVTPLTYQDPANSSADVVVFRLRAYKATFAADSSDAPDGTSHVHLEPYDYIKHDVPNVDNVFYLSDLYVDNANGLPSKVRYTGADDIDFTVDYGTVEGHWLVEHAHYEETVYGPLRLGRVHFVADATYDQYAFPPSAPDSRLAN
jgi:hypothetical protein